MKKLSGILLIISSALLIPIQIYYLNNNLDYAFSNPIYLADRIVYILFLISLILIGSFLLSDSQSNGQIKNIDNINEYDSPDLILNIISFLIPIAGLIIYIVDKDNHPNRAKSAGKFAILGLIISFTLSILLFAIIFLLQL